jgi:hypothetical protein
MAFYEDKTITPSQLVLGDPSLMVTEKVTILRASGIALALTAGHLMGKITKGAITVGAAVAAGALAGGANTGTGTCTKDVDTPNLAGVQLGAYLIRVTREYVEAGTVAGAYEVFDPEGDYLGSGTIGDTWEKQIKFELAEAEADGTKFVVGDAFTITVTQAAGSGYLTEFDPAAVDGSEIPYGILLNDVTVPTDGEATGSYVYLNGKFNQNAVTAKSGVTVANYKDALRAIGIYLVDQTDEI